MGSLEENCLAFVGPRQEKDGKAQSIELKLHEDFTPMALGGSGKFSAPLVFAGYGITAEDAGYDDYADIDVKGKAVLILRKEPQQDNPKSKFNGKRPSVHATFRQKVANAQKHGAAAVIVVNDLFELDRKQAA